MITRSSVSALGAAALFTVMGVPAVASSSMSPRLSGTVIVDTTHSGVEEVVLPRDAAVSLPRGVAFSGKGRFVGVWLERTDGAVDGLTSYRLPPFAGGGQVTFGPSPARCKGVPSEALPLASDCTDVGAPTSVVLHKGTYRVTVLTDNQPLRITLHLAGPPGITRLPTLRQLASIQKPLPAREKLGSHLVTFGSASVVHGPAQTFVVAAARSHSDGALDSATLCQRADDGAAPLSFGPSCAGGSAGGYQYRVRAGNEVIGGSGAFAGTSSSPPGVVGLGGSFANSSGVVFREALGIWLERP
jgi:hypothetical protein